MTDHRYPYKIPFKNAKQVLMSAIAVAKRMKTLQWNFIEDENQPYKPSRKNALEVLLMALQAGKRAHYIFEFKDMSFTKAQDYFEVSCRSEQGTTSYILLIELTPANAALVIKKHNLREIRF